MSKSLLSVAQRAVVASLILIALVSSSGLAARASELQADEGFRRRRAGRRALRDKVRRRARAVGARHRQHSDVDGRRPGQRPLVRVAELFDWTNEPNSPHLVAKTFPGLLEAQGILYDRGNTCTRRSRTSRRSSPSCKSLASATILLTSRGPEFRDPTERELKRCGYDFAASALPVHGLSDKATILPYDPANPEERRSDCGRSLAKYKLGDAPARAYTDGIFMTAGQHKGMMLLTLLQKSPSRYQGDRVRRRQCSPRRQRVFSGSVHGTSKSLRIQYQYEDAARAAVSIRR